MRFRLLAVAVAAVLSAVPAAAQTIIAPASGVINAGGPGAGSLSNTFDQSGLSAGYTSGVTGFDAYLAGNPIHDLAFSGNEWFSNLDTSAATVTYDFGSVVTIDRLALWNEDASGIGTLALFGSADGVTFGSLGSFSPFNNPVRADYPAEVFGFAATPARYVRFDMSDCPQSDSRQLFDSCAIGEVAFRTASGAIPEPGSWALMIAGFGLVGGALRFRRRTVMASYA